MMQGGYDWWQNLDKAFRDLKYIASRANSCVRYKRIGNKHTIIDTYNDNLLGASTTIEGAEAAKKELGDKYKIQDIGDLKYILGIRFD
ncbi:hypothetical protein C0991_001783 [Blastosporella zonata]|nr:hypothetical protein C0991_001783 [Blastosporella zonata]